MISFVLSQIAWCGIFISDGHFQGLVILSLSSSTLFVLVWSGLAAVVSSACVRGFQAIADLNQPGSAELHSVLLFVLYKSGCHWSLLLVQAYTTVAYGGPAGPSHGWYLYLADRSIPGTLAAWKEYELMMKKANRRINAPPHERGYGFFYYRVKGTKRRCQIDLSRMPQPDPQFRVAAMRSFEAIKSARKLLPTWSTPAWALPSFSLQSMQIWL
jgi:hypothetical protein